MNEAYARASETEQRLCRELEEYTYSWGREFGRPQNICDKFWQMMQSNNAKSENFEKESAKTTRVSTEKEDDKSPGL